MAITKEPVTIGGWYEHDDGTVGEYTWFEGQVKLSRTVATWADVPSREDDMRAETDAHKARHAGDVRPD